jgi:hypothetical protein
MGKMDDARRHAKQIEYYYHHAGESGYRQAVYHWNELCELARRSHKNDTPVIEGIRQSVKHMIDEMKQKEKCSD